MPDRRTHARPDDGGVPTKTCATCGRVITWRKAWERNWEQVRFCSDGCRTHRPGAREAELEQMILALLAARGRGKTICPSEAARAAAATDDRSKWEPLMEPVRQAARRLVAQGRLEITQGGQVVDPSTAKGAIRLRLRG